MEMEIDLFKLSIELFKVDMEEPKKKRKRITKNYE